VKPPHRSIGGNWRSVAISRENSDIPFKAQRGTVSALHDRATKRKTAEINVGDAAIGSPAAARIDVDRESRRADNRREPIRALSSQPSA
jgi:hypothetical protein